MVPDSVLCSEFWKRKARHAEIRWLVTIWNSERRQSEEWSLSLSLSLFLGRPSLLVCFPVPHPGHGSSVVAAASRAAKPPITEHQKAVSLSWSTWFACLIICSLNLCGFVCTFRDRQPSKPSSVTPPSTPSNSIRLRLEDSLDTQKGVRNVKNLLPNHAMSEGCGARSKAREGNANGNGKCSRRSFVAHALIQFSGKCPAHEHNSLVSYVFGGELI